MLRGAVAGRYAEALYELASREKVLPKYKSAAQRVEEELKAVEKAINENPDLQKLFYHPQITPADKKEILSKIFGGKVSRLTANFLALLVDKRREAFFRDIVAEYVKLVNASRNIAEARITSAVELTAEEKAGINQVLARMTGKKVVATYHVDPALIGGVVVRIGDKIIDGSVKTRLATLRERLLAIS